MIRHLEVLLFILVFAGRSVIQGLPDGAPVCKVGEAAPNPVFHKFPLGGIINGFFQISIGGTVLLENQKATLHAGVDLPVVISSTNGASVFKGVLAVLNHPTISLVNGLRPTATAPLKEQAACAPQGFAGFTHILNDPKSSVEGIFRVNQNIDEAFMDVNLVVSNSAHSQIYFYSRFTIATVGAPPVPTPMALPVPTPMELPVPTPMVLPVPTPMALPVPTPVSLPLPTPKALPVPTPVSLPVPTPKALPVPTPVAPVFVPQRVPAPIPAPIPCGLFGWFNFFCIFGCGFFFKLLGLCTD